MASALLGLRTSSPMTLLFVSKRRKAIWVTRQKHATGVRESNHGRAMAWCSCRSEAKAIQTFTSGNQPPSIEKGINLGVGQRRQGTRLTGSNQRQLHMVLLRGR